MNDREREALKKTGSFITVFGLTFDGRMIRAFLWGAAFCVWWEMCP